MKPAQSVSRILCGMAVLLAMIFNAAPAGEDDTTFRGNPDQVLQTLTQAIEKEPESAALRKTRAALFSRSHEFKKAGDDLAEAAKLGDPSAFRQAGAAYFFAGQFDASINAFDAFAKHFPEQAPQLWERGISLYYAKRCAEGRRQFEDHQKVNPHDVENAAWHFICTAKEMGAEKARKLLLAIDTNQDPRVPMKEVYQLFKGESTPEAVLAAATAGDPAGTVLKNNLCYAHLYLGLYFEALGDDQKAREHIKMAAINFSQQHYMGQVARVHWELIGAKK